MYSCAAAGHLDAFAAQSTNRSAVTELVPLLSCHAAVSASFFVSLGQPSALTVKSMQEKATREKPFIVLNVAMQGEVTWGGDSQPHSLSQTTCLYLSRKRMLA